MHLVPLLTGFAASASAFHVRRMSAPSMCGARASPSSSRSPRHSLRRSPRQIPSTAHGMERRREPVSPTSPFPSSAKLPPWYYPTVSIRSAELRSDRLTFMPLHACEHYPGPACLMPRSCSMPKVRCTWWTVGLPVVVHRTHIYLPSNLLIDNHILNMLGHADRTPTRRRSIVAEAGLRC
jgi:hypothetical protein